MGLLRFLLITIVILWTIRILFRLLFPVLIKKMVTKMQNQATQNHYQRYTGFRKPEGKITVDYIPPKDKETRVDEKAGEFIDYEEIK